MTRILVLGGSGMLGHKVVQRLHSTGHDVWWTLRGDRSDPDLRPVPLLSSDRALTHVDALDRSALKHTLHELRPDVVVNCLGVIKQRSEADNERLCMALNADLPHDLAKWIAPWNGWLIQVSTDCVFAGTRGGYTEMDAPDAVDIYGRSKALGEVRADNAIVLRTSVIGRELKHHVSLLDWFLSQRGRQVSGFQNVFWSGITTLEFATIVEHLLNNHRGLAGLFHVSSGRISKHDLLVMVRRAFALDVDIMPDNAVRRDVSLVGTLFESTTGYQCAPLAQQVEALAADPTPYI